MIFLLVFYFISIFLKTLEKKLNIKKLTFLLEKNIKAIYKNKYILLQNNNIFHFFLSSSKVQVFFISSSFYNFSDILVQSYSLLVYF